MREHVAEWKREVSRALKDRGLTNHAVSQKLGVSHATFSAWMSGGTRPNIDLLPRISELTGIPTWRLHYLAGYVPESYAPGVMLDQTWRRQHELYSNIRDWASRMLDATSIHPVAQAVGVLNDYNLSWQVTVRPNLKGHAHKLAPNTVLIIEPLDSSASLSQLRSEVNEKLGRRLAQVGVNWRHQSLEGVNLQAGLVLEAPEFERSRVSRFDSVTGLPNTIVVLGLPFSHAETFGALLADATGCGFENPKSQTLRYFESEVEITLAQIASVTRRRLREAFSSPTSVEAPTIITLTYPGSVDVEDLHYTQQHLIAEHDVEFVYIRTFERHLEYAADYWNIDSTILREMRHEMEQFVDKTSVNCTVLEISDDEIFDVQNTSIKPGDRMVDCVVELALTYLRGREIGPSELSGYLGSLNAGHSDRT